MVTGCRFTVCVLETIHSIRRAGMRTSRLVSGYFVENPFRQVLLRYLNADVIASYPILYTRSKSGPTPSIASRGISFPGLIAISWNLQFIFLETKIALP